MRPTWTGAITFGLFNIPVSVYTATEDSGPSLNYVHAHDGGRVSQRWVCKDCGEEVAYGDLGRGHEIGKDEKKRPIMVCFTDAELEAATGPKSRSAELIEFVDADQVPTELYGSLYYLGVPLPAKTTRNACAARQTADARPYVMLRETLRRSNWAAIVSIGLRGKPQRAMLTVVEDVIVMRMLLWPEQVRAPYFSGHADGRVPSVAMSEQELDRSIAAFSMFHRKWDAANHVDPYATEMARLVEEKTAARINPVEPAAMGDNVVSLLDRMAARVSAASSVSTG